MILAALIGLTAQDAPPAARFEVPAEYRLIEGVASDGDAIWLSSVVDRKIIAYRRGRFRAFALPGGDGAPLGIAWDARRKWLWIAANCPVQLPHPGCHGSGLLAMEGKGRIRARLKPEAAKRFAADGSALFVPGDVSVWKGQVFVSDGLNGAVYRCRADCNALVPVIAPRQKGSAQGTAVYDQGRKLLVADYGLGLISVDLATNAETPILLEDGNTLRGIDGLVADGDGSFLAVRNASTPGKVWRFRISGDHIVDPQVAAAGGDVVDPTQIARAGKQFLLIGDSQWSAHLPDKEGKVSGAQRPTSVIAIPAR